jgi:hypothetical protein
LKSNAIPISFSKFDSFGKKKIEEFPTKANREDSKSEGISEKEDYENEGFD